MKWNLLLCSLSVALGENSSCDCKCCGVEENRQSNAFQCALVEDGIGFLHPFRYQGPQCKGVCHKPAGDLVLDSAEDEVDWQRFCLFDCLPEKQEKGAMCRKLTKKDIDDREDDSGNGHLPVYPKLHVETKQQQTIKRRAQTKVDKDDPWGSVLSDDAKKVKTRADQFANDANEDLDKAQTATATVQDVLSKNKSVIPSLVESVKATAKAAKEAFDIQRATEKLRDEVVEAAQETAEDAVEDAVKQIRNQAKSKTKAAALKRADALAQKIKDDAPKAGAEAMKPYDLAMKRVAATAQAYLKDGDGLASASIGLQAQAQLLSQGANAYTAAGNQPEGQKLLMQAHQTMDLAKSLKGAATSMYGTAKKIQASLNSYVSEAGAAAYHAERMVNPDALPPPPANPLFRGGPPNYDVLSVFNDPSTPNELAPYDAAAGETADFSKVQASRDALPPPPADVPLP